LGVYNFAGDIGKAVLPGATSLLLVVLSWHQTLRAIAALGLAVAILIAMLMPNVGRTASSVRTEDHRTRTASKGFILLFVSGKFICGWLGARIGVLWSVVLTEMGTAAAIILVLILPLPATWIVLPLLGALLNGTSSVLYGTVPGVASPGQTEHAFALFYTGVIGSGALFPIVYGSLGDVVGIYWATIATATTALAILPLAVALASELQFD
jgi:MFS transporter, FSR family, fosmidomycin resistance protein